MNIKGARAAVQLLFVRNFSFEMLETLGQRGRSLGALGAEGGNPGLVLQPCDLQQSRAAPIPASPNHSLLLSCN